MDKIKTVYGVKHKNEETRAASRSGGFFTAVTDKVIDEGGIVYGCGLDDKFQAVFKRAETKQERDEFRGSKYVQADIGYCFRQAEQDLKSGKTVLFSGVPCHIHGLLNFLKVKKTDTSNLITLEILCHGAPSPRIWQDFLEQNYKDVESVDFRDKKNFGWRDHVETVTVNGREYSTKIYTDLFYSHVMLRQSCFKCPYKKRERNSDITIGDFWRIENNDPEYDDDKGVSLVLINSDKGREWFDKCENELIIREYPLANCIQPALDHNYDEPSEREAFWKEYNSENIDALSEKYGKFHPSFKYKVKVKLKAVLHNVVKAAVKLAGV